MVRINEEEGFLRDGVTCMERIFHISFSQTVNPAQLSMYVVIQPYYSFDSVDEHEKMGQFFST